MAICGASELTVWCCAADIRRMNGEAVFAKRTGMIVLGGGLPKHHIFNANLMVREASESSEPVSGAAERQ